MAYQPTDLFNVPGIVKLVWGVSCLQGALNLGNLYKVMRSTDRRKIGSKLL